MLVLTAVALHVLVPCGCSPTSAESLLHQHLCEAGLPGSKELSEADGFNLHSAAAGVGHTADQLGDAPGVMFQDCVQCLCIVACSSTGRPHFLCVCRQGHTCFGHLGSMAHIHMTVHTVVTEQVQTCTHASEQLCEQTMHVQRSALCGFSIAFVTVCW